MTHSLLDQTARSALQSFVDRSGKGTAYLRRAQILLLADDEVPPETIAADLSVPIVHVRNLLRAYRREGLDLFPREIVLPPLFSADESLPEAGRKIMAELIGQIRAHETALADATDVTSVHETRKGIRRLRTALRMFAPYFEPGLLDDYSRRFRKSMGRLGRSRDTAVFLYKLDMYISRGAAFLEADELTALEALRDYWRERQADTDEEVRQYLAKGKFHSLLSEFDQFTHSPFMGVPVTTDPLFPPKVGPVAPVLIYERVAAVRAYSEHLAGAPLKRLHALRMRCKELRYTLEFFEPVMGRAGTEALATVVQLFAHLGDLNDARIHLEMLGRVEDEDLAPGVSLYRQAKEVELEQLIESLPGLWNEFDQLGWRQRLAAAVAVL